MTAHCAFASKPKNARAIVRHTIIFFIVLLFYSLILIRAEVAFGLLLCPDIFTESGK